MPKVHIDTNYQDITELINGVQDEFENTPIFIRTQKKHRFDDGTQLKDNGIKKIRQFKKKKEKLNDD